MSNIVRALLVFSFFGIPSALFSASDYLPEPTQDSAAPFRLFRTSNIYTLLKLDTRTGQIWEVQWGTPSEMRLLNNVLLAPLPPGKDPEKLQAEDFSPGRFTLSPTQNIYTFLLLDQQSGRVWYVQWGSNRFIMEIPAAR